MFKKTLAVAIGSLLIGLSFAASAHGGGGGGGGGGFAGGGSFGGAASGHGHEAMMNSNGSFSSDRDKGLQRAGDRRSSEGASHEKAHVDRTHHNGNRGQKH